MVGPVLEQLLFTPEQLIQFGRVEDSESTPQDDEMAGGDGTDRVQLETAKASHYFQNTVRVRVFWLVSREILFGNCETPGVL